MSGDHATGRGRDCPAARSVVVDGVTLRRGSPVRLRPSCRADVFDLALTGRAAEVDAVEEDMEGRVQVVVTLCDDPGRDLRTGLGHRFFFSPEELEPVTSGGAGEGDGGGPRVLVAGIGNVFLADDGFGPEAVTALCRGPLPAGVHAADFGIRGLDLAYRLLEGYETAVLVDAAPRGGKPGTLYLIEPEADGSPETEAAPEAHAMDPVRVLALARCVAAGQRLPRVLVLGCEPVVRMTGAEPDVAVGLSPPVRAAAEEAVPLLESLVEQLLDDPSSPLDGPVPGLSPTTAGRR